MINRHIIKILDNNKFSEISAEEQAAIDAHILDCRDCRAALRAAQTASILLSESSKAETRVPTPFFQTKVLSAWREKQTAPKRVAVFRRWWQASAALVSMMILIVAGLITATLIGSRHRAAVNQKIGSDAALYSTETVILNEKPTGDLTTGQIFEVLYDNNN